MKNLTITTSVALLLTSLGSLAQQAEVLPRAFYKRCLVTSVTGGPSKVSYSTYNNDGVKVKSGLEIGRIDPLIMEYGLTDKIGIGFSKGGESYYIDANKYYNAAVPDASKMMWASTSYFTADFSYHPYVTKRLDVSLFASAGFFSIYGDCYDGSMYYCGAKPLYTYNASGATLRAGMRSRFYFSKRFGFMTSIYSFSGLAKERTKPNPVADQPNHSGYYSMLNGIGIEYGICFRLFKQKGVTQQAQKSLKERWNEKRSKKVQQEDEESDKKPLFRWVRD